MQHITYTEYVPLFTGSPMPRYAGYNSSADPRLDVAVSAAALRYGHSAVGALLFLLDEDFNPLREAPFIPLESAVWSTAPIAVHGLLPLLRGLVAGVDEAVDARVVAALRSGVGAAAPAAFPAGYDLYATDVMRGRDAGLPRYNALRVAYGLPPATNVTALTGGGRGDGVTAALADVYGGDVDAVDAFIGGLAEPPLPSGVLGPLFAAILGEQFARSRSADRFAYEVDPMLSEADREAIARDSLSRVIVRVTNASWFPESPFKAALASPVPATGVASLTQHTVALRSDMSLAWTYDAGGGTLRVTLRVASADVGWVGLGFGGDGMDDADMYMGACAAPRASEACALCGA